ncbi:hypothetical protein C7M61_004691 [Candidozyma pseudohaemuli]|uniref:Uncharacterized protein n=1 Tax=Candidozyma pseudohaemuli TaxID=418784 RepID=A0A2P7YGZ2_9ASCO|nr:hypothetical protein C7M61_004691 [[Candida] pseudohaemulonii]PSK35233.1 hypothetical protein C7M61_004691 [[Candida] pseudohaemulonii]
MSTRIIHFIEDDYNQLIVEEALSRLITKKPSHYVSHEVSKIICGNKTWNVTALQLNGATKMKGEEMQDSFIRRARRKDGVLVFGSGPNLHDGTCRVVVSVFKRKQLDLSHIESHIKNSFCGRVEMGKSIYAARCLEVGGSIFQYTPAFECKAFTKYYHSDAQSMKERTIDTEDNSIIRGKLEVKYVPFSYIGTIEKYNLLYPRLNVKNDFSLRLVQLKPSWCGCMLSVMATRVKVTAIETTACKIPFNEEYRYQEEVREVILKDERVNIVINELDLRGDDRHFELDSSLYSCTLPNLGVTFFSRNCSRRYALRFSITLMCLEQKCTSTFDVTMDVVVPLEEYKKEALYVRSIELPQLKYEPFEDFTLNLTNGCAKFPKEVFPGILPPFKPTSVTSQSLCHTIICIRLEVKTFFSSAESVELIEELVVPGDYEALVESSLLPPYVEVDEKRTVVE